MRALGVPAGAGFEDRCSSKSFRTKEGAHAVKEVIANNPNRIMPDGNRSRGTQIIWKNYNCSMELPAYFLSDLHLGCQHPLAIADREARAIDLLRSWKSAASHVFLVGDVFEFWMEYRDYVNRHHFALFRALAELVESGVEVHYLSGNHDFQLDTFFPKELGVHVHRSLKIELQGRKLWIQHGDGVAKSDWKYRIASRILHSPLDIFLFRLLHPDWGMSLARWVGQKSRHANLDKDPLLSEYRAWALEVMARESCDTVVHGHNHHAGIEILPQGIHATTGQWLFELGYLEMRAGQFTWKPVHVNQS